MMPVATFAAARRADAQGSISACGKDRVRMEGKTCNVAGSSSTTRRAAEATSGTDGVGRSHIDRPCNLGWMLSGNQGRRCAPPEILISNVLRSCQLATDVSVVPYQVPLYPLTVSTQQVW